MALQYRELSQELQEQILEDRRTHWENPWRCKDSEALRRYPDHDRPNLWRPAFVRDTEKIIHLPYYNRYTDKTQVFSFYDNDDLSRRALHVQLVSRIARNIGRVLGLNTDLIEAIALGHDIGHTPFGHAGERFLNELLQEKTGRCFFHNVQSARVLDTLFRRNISLQTLDGVLCHNGEFEQQEYRPVASMSFEEFDRRMESCFREGGKAVDRLIPFTLEGCVVRISDMIAYLGKDRQDARIAHIIDEDVRFSSQAIGTENAAIINNITVDILENSYRKPYLLLSPSVYQDLKKAKDENYRYIYKNESVNTLLQEEVRPMFREMYEKLLSDVKSGDTGTIVFRHHIAFVEEQLRYYRSFDYRAQEPNQIVVDYMASMTDDYFVALYRELFPSSTRKISYHSYFET